METRNSSEPPDFQNIFESCPSPLLVLSTSFVIVAVSNTYLKATNTKRSEIIGQYLFDVFPDNPDDPDTTAVANMKASLNRVMQNKTADTYAIQRHDIRLPNDEGEGYEERYWKPGNSPVFGPDNEIIYIIHNVEDVTDLMIRSKNKADELMKSAHYLDEANEKLILITKELTLAKEKVKLEAELIIANKELAIQITERKQSELALKESNNIFISLTNLIPVYIAYVNADTLQYEFVNDMFEKSFGISRGKLIGSHIKDVIGEDNYQFALKYINEVKSGKSVSYENTFDIASGKRWIQVNYSPVFDANNKVVGIAVVSYDISERKQMEEDVIKSQLLLSSIIECQKDIIIFLIDKNYQYLHFNKAHFDVMKYAYNKDIKVGMNILDCISLEDDRIVAKENYDRAFAGESHSNIRMFGDVNPAYYESFFNPISNEKNEILGCTGLARNITARIESDLKLHESEEKWRTLFEILPVGVSLLDKNGIVSEYNQSLIEILNLTEEGINNEAYKNRKYINSDFQEMDSEEFPSTLALKENKTIIDTEIGVIMEDGSTIWTKVSAAPLKLKDSICAIVTNDITESKKAEEQLKNRISEITAINKELELFAHANEELEQFAFIASHNLQEPLRTISNFVHIMSEDYSEQLDNKAQQYLNIINDASKRMLIQLNSLLDYSRLGRNLKLTKVDCSHSIDNVIADLKSIIAISNASIEVGEMPELNVYENEFHQLFQNLISNAIKFHRKDISPEILITSEKQNDLWKFSVIDNGIGIKPENIDKMFVMFQRLNSDSEYPGSGIGLAFCKKIVQLHKGEIWVESTIGKGTTFNFTIAILNT